MGSKLVIFILFIYYNAIVMQLRIHCSNNVKTNTTDFVVNPSALPPPTPTKSGTDYTESIRENLIEELSDTKPSQNSTEELPHETEAIYPDDNGSEEAKEEARESKQTDTNTNTNETDTTPETTGVSATDAPITMTNDTKRSPIECISDSYCFNGGTCVVLENGQLSCICPEEFYGTRCQTRNICKTIVVDTLTGDQVCARIQRECFKSDKFFRCECLDDEYFVFKADQISTNSQSIEGCSKSPCTVRVRDPHSFFAYDSLLPLEHDPYDDSTTDRNNNDARKVSSTMGQSYLAECRKIDKCLGVRCRQLSETCIDGKCQCNRNLGYIRDPSDHLCKLLDPCRMPTRDGSSICGQAKCVATYDSELYRCVCPIGYKAIKKDEHKNSTQCALLSNDLCDIPFLNKCQHICKIDRHNNNYRCSCLPGYKPGTRPGIDDFMCFFDENIEQIDSDLFVESNVKSDNYGRSPTMSKRSAQQFNFKAYPADMYQRPMEPVVRIYASGSVNHTHNNYDNDTAHEDERSKSSMDESLRSSSPRSRHFIIKREPVESLNTDDGDRAPRRDRSTSSMDGYIERDNFYIAGRGGDAYDEVNLSLLSAQERCNMYCEDNKICVLEDGSNDSYRCVCDRQGYVSIGDRCLDWCSAAEFSHSVAYWVTQICYSGACMQSSTKPSSSFNTKEKDLTNLERKSSWRPTFECDCSTSSILFKDPKTKMCKIDFNEVLRPCLPGNEGYIDCVQNKNSYCSVLHRSFGLFMWDLQKVQPTIDPDPFVATKNIKTSSQEDKAKKLKAAKEKLYTCVCSPEKKFLVDKPRNKARCIDECDLLNNECGRFNRMCRAAAIDPDKFNHRGSMLNLVRYDQNGYRMDQFKRTGCECLPGFNVGPLESVDFFLDDNSLQPNSVTGEPFPTIQDGILQGEWTPELNQNLRAKYMNINSRCLLDYDVVEFHATFKAPADFEPSWIKIRNTIPLEFDQSRAEGLRNSTEKLYPDTVDEERERYMMEQEDKLDGLLGVDSRFIRFATYEATNKHERQQASDNETQFCSNSDECLLKVPDFMRTDISDFHKSVVFVAQCNPAMAFLSLEAYRECTRYRYWIVQKLRNHFTDWRQVMSKHLKETFDLMDGNIRLRVNKCEAIIKRISTIPRAFAQSMEKPTDKEQVAINAKVAANSKASSSLPGAIGSQYSEFDPLDQYALIDADLDCELTIHSASNDSSHRRARKVLLEKQLPKFIFNKTSEKLSQDYYLMAPDILIQRESFDQLAKHRKSFSPCKSDYAYCDKQTRCDMVDTVNFSCTCEYGYTPIGSRDIYRGDSRMEVCEDIDECLFDVCKENGLENKSICINEIGDYKCQCIRHHVGDNKRYCNHICNIIACKFGDCRIPDEHHAYCECFDGYREADCSVQDPSVALRKANMIICGSIFTSVLLLAITLAISLNSQLKKTKKKLKRLEAANEAAQLFELPHQQPFRSRLSKVSVCS